MKKLFICERPYILYKSILKTLHSEDEIDLILSNHMPGMEKLYLPLKESGLFHKVFYFDDDLYQEYIQNEMLADYVLFPNILLAWPRKLKKYFTFQKKARQKELPSELCYKDYDEIVAVDGVSTLNFWLNFQKVPYVVSEHARNNFKIKIFWHIVAVYLSIVLDRLNLIVAYSGCSKFVKAIEVNDNTDLVCYLKNKEIRECNISQLECSLSEESKDKIYQIYAKAFSLPLSYEEEINVLLTTPLAHDKIVETVEDQINCYRDVVKQYCDDGRKLLIKAHPRDDIDYKALFPQAIVVDKLVSAEILGYSRALKVNRVLTITSSTVNSFHNARETIILEQSFLEKYHLVSKKVGARV